MTDRLTPLDASFLYLEEATTSMHVGSVAVFETPVDGFDFDRLVALISERIALVPRYRQRIKNVPGRLANPVWVDDTNFDISYHVRRSALPRPGTDEQLRELVARLESRRLDRERPLWEMYVVEGLAGGRFAVVTKTHHAMVDGASAIDIGQVILDITPEPRAGPPDEWRAKGGPSALELVAGAFADLARRPGALIDMSRAAFGDMRKALLGLAGAAGGLAAALRTAARPAPPSPLNADIGEARRYATADTELDAYKRIRKAHGGTVNDVILATVAGALRSWLLMRGESVPRSSTVRALVPVSIRAPGEEAAIGNRVSSYLVDLPIGEPSPVMRLHEVSYAMRGHKESGQAVGAEALVGLAGFAPPTLHALGARAMSSLSRRVFNVIVTNVPGPQFPLYAAGAKMISAYPVVPLAKGQAVSIGVTSYDGGVFYGFYADREVMSDVEVLATFVTEALTELLETVR